MLGTILNILVVDDFASDLRRKSNRAKARAVPTSQYNHKYVRTPKGPKRPALFVEGGKM